MSEFTVGDTLRATFEGTITSVIGTSVNLETNDGLMWGFNARDIGAGLHVERIEPTYEDGDVVLDAEGMVFEYCLCREDGRWSSPGGVLDGKPLRPLTILARGGKPYTKVRNT